MRRYTIRINETEHVLDVEAVTAELFRVHLGDRVVDVQLDDHRDLAQAVISPDATAGLTVAASGSAGSSASSSGPAPSAASSPAVPATPARTGGVTSAGAGVLTAPMPGVVVSVEAPVGTAVSRGDVLLVLEAMKMNNPLRAPRDGVVTEVLVDPGSSVAYGAVLARVGDA